MKFKEFYSFIFIIVSLFQWLAQWDFYPFLRFEDPFEALCADDDGK